MKKLCLFPIIICCLSVQSQNTIKIDGKNCGLHGAASKTSKVYTLNSLKNRYAIPKQDDFDDQITFDSLAHSADPNQFSTDNAVTLTGYVYKVKVGGVESCNCKTKNAKYRDTHIELTPNSTDTSAEFRVIVEITARMRSKMAKKGIDWSTKTLKHTLPGHTIQVKGWLMYDAEHEMQSFANNPDNANGKNWRASVWEIHPITELTIQDQ